MSGYEDGQVHDWLTWKSQILRVPDGTASDTETVQKTPIQWTMPRMQPTNNITVRFNLSRNKRPK